MVYYIVTMATIVDSLTAKALLFFLWIASHCEAYQKSVHIDVPCTEEQQYVLGHGDVLYIGAEGNRYFKRSCAINLQAWDKNRKCSKLCFSVDSFRFNTCDLQLSFYNSGVWNFGTAKADYKGDCRRSAQGDWCTSGNTATVRLENLKGIRARMVGKYEFQMVAVARCSEEKTIPETNWMDGGDTLGLNTTVIVGVVLGCVILCMSIAIILLLVMYKRRQNGPYHAAATSNHHVHNSPETSYHDHPVQESCGIPISSDQDEDTVQKEKELELPQKQHPEPSAPPIDGSFTDLRPPSYCGAPPGYNNGKTVEPNSPVDEEKVI